MYQEMLANENINMIFIDICFSEGALFSGVTSSMASKSKK